MTAEIVQENEQNLENRFNILEAELDYYRESYEDAVRALVGLDNIGWDLYTGVDSTEGFTLEQLQQVSKQLREWADTNPLLARGHEIRCSYLYGAGYKIGTSGSNSKVSARVQSLIDLPQNQAAIFAEEALSQNERARYTDCVALALFNRVTNTFQRISLNQIKDAASNPDDAEVIWYYLRSWSRETVDPITGTRKIEPMNVWYKTDTAIEQGAPDYKTINGDPVDTRYVMVDDVVGRHTGNKWGVPDSFVAAPWALAYSAYLKDGTKVLAALAEIAWKLTPKSKNQADKAGAKVKTRSGAGSTVITDMDVQSMPRANAVDLSTGRPLAAQVASALGVSVVILLSDPGQSGAYGTAQTLTDPSIRTLQARQKIAGRFLVRCLRLLGLKSPEILWEKMSPDADYREMQTLIAATGTGAFWPDEIREPMAKLANITLLHDDVPDGFLIPNNSNSADRADIDQDANGSTIKPDGTTELTNGQGKPANTAKPSYGNNDLRGTGGRA